jgi:hypothetical protein
VEASSDAEAKTNLKGKVQNLRMPLSSSQGQVPGREFFEML